MKLANERLGGFDMSFEVWFEGTLFFFETDNDKVVFERSIREYKDSLVALTAADQASKEAQAELNRKALNAWLRTTTLKQAVEKANCSARKPQSPQLDSDINRLCVVLGYEQEG